MGEGKRKKARQLAGHAFCYCCGTKPPVEIEHFPPRICFPSGMHPETFEFPVCVRCNRSTSGLEQVVALYIEAFNQDDEPRDKDHMRKVIRGVRNNHAHLLPDINVSVREKRRYLSDAGIAKPPGRAIAGLPIAALPDESAEAFQKFANKLACAHYFRRFQKPLPLDFMVWAEWMPFYEPQTVELVGDLLTVLKFAEKGERRNVDIGSRMVWRWVEDDEGLFAVLTQFSQSFFFITAMAPSEQGTPEMDWQRHSDFVKSLA